MNLDDIKKELKRKNITFEHIRGRIDVATVSGKPSLNHYWAEYNTPRTYTFAFAVNNGNIFSVIYQKNILKKGNDFFLHSTDVCEPVTKLGDLWRVVNNPKEKESVEKFVQRSMEWFEGFRNHLLKVSKEECRRKLVRNILNGTIEEFSKDMKKVRKENDINHLDVSGELNNIPVKLGWHSINGGKDFIITLVIGKTHSRMIFSNTWKTKFNVKDFISKSIKFYEFSNNENDNTEKMEK